MLRLIVLLTIASAKVHAATCDVVDLSHPLSVVFQYDAPCDQTKFPGIYGDSTKTQHMLDSDLQAQMVTRDQATSAAQVAKQRRIDALTTACSGAAAKASVVFQALCDRLLNDLN